MTDLEMLIETSKRLSDRLANMAIDEKTFGHELCYQLEQLSYQFYCSSCDLTQINNWLVGGVA